MNTFTFQNTRWWKLLFLHWLCIVPSQSLPDLMGQVTTWDQMITNYKNYLPMKLILIVFLPLIQNLMLTNLYWVEKQDLPVVIKNVTLIVIVLVQIHAISVVGGLDTEISALIQTVLFIASLQILWVLQLLCFKAKWKDRSFCSHVILYQFNEWFHPVK